MSTAADKDPMLAALPAEVRVKVEQGLAAYETEASPSQSFSLFPEQPKVTDTDWDAIVADMETRGLPKQPPRKKPGPRYVANGGSQPAGWVARSIKQSGRPPPKPPPKPLPDRPAWGSSPSGRWRTTGVGAILADRRA